MFRFISLFLICAFSASALGIGMLGHVSRYKTYELQYVSAKSSTPRVDKIFTPCAILANKRVTWAEPGERAEPFVKKIVRDYYFNKEIVVTYQRIPSTVSGSQSAVNALYNIGEETEEYKTSRATIHRALARALTRQSWLDLYIGEVKNESGEKVYGFFTVIDEKNLEILLVGDGVCNEEHEEER